MQLHRLAVSCVTAALLGAGAAAAETAPQPYSDFTFKRISAPSASGSKRITVQIDPEEQARRLATPQLPPPENPIPRGGAAPGLLPAAPSGPSEYDWYWDNVSPALGAGAGRFPLALAALTQGPEGSAVAAPRLQHMQDIARLHGREILAATIGTEVSPALVLAVIGIESAGRADAVSSAGAVGLMQLIPATADRFGVADSADPIDNIKGGVAYLDWLMNEFGGDPLMVLAAYNAGENAVKKNDGVPPYAETRAYVPKVLAAWTVARGLCVTPPELVSDGCVFAANG
ncbi:Soluble lytic murein transglycosylase [Defluviimonas aquaemixtae]|uniref:Soluble lytic murein transglycosylase n=1 Tax=Albidovulum aquaemixtae TaxID=1542388 RepID=A0A2R8BMI2_9RHOB|nr:lytic transglycosylase domain-containing protein [Defluviimonas aquaemixtae]SPH24638.1 Soluble lytic murein transglycosylase [Defluviimonas aquaemixtae]